MKRLVSWSVVLVLAGCTVPSLEELENERGQVQVLVAYTPSFKTGCFVVRYLDATNVELGRDNFSDLGTLSSPLKIAVIRKPGWPEQVRFVVTAHEQDCENTAVVTEASVELYLSGTGLQEGRTQTLTLVTPDRDGDGYVDAASGGTDCNDESTNARPNGPMETCDGLDNDCQGGIDNGLPRTEFYRDGDGDGVGAGTVVLACIAPVGHVTRNGDCDDANANASPDKTERCNGEDDNCSGVADEPFLTGSTAKGANCDNDTCNGVYVCNPAQTATVCNAPAPTLYHADVDRDGEGAAGSGAEKVCPGGMPTAGRVANQLDCDDVDPGTKSTAAEVCDAIDNNCNTQLDEGLTCGSGGGFGRIYDGALGGGGHYWRTVAVGATTGYPVWIAGLGGKLVRKATAAAAFENHSFGETPATTTHCGDYDWYASWVRPSDGHVFLAGEGGRVAEHTGAACINSVDAPGFANVTSMVGFVVSGVTTLYLVSDDARLYTWVPGNAPSERNNANGFYNAIHAVDPSLLLVAGRDGSGAGTQFIAEYANSTLGTEVRHTLSNAIAGGVNALWMGSSSLAYAVGDGSSIWSWNGVRGWSLVSPPPGAVVNFSSVAMPPGLDVVYVVDKGSPGRLRRKTSFGWARAPVITPLDASEPANVDVPLHDIAMTSVGEFWIVGDGGRVYRYPR